MNREQTIEAIKVMQAWVDGKTIQFGYGGKWVNLKGSPQWSCDVKYRIKPEPLVMYVSYDADGRITGYGEDGPGRPLSDRTVVVRKFVEVMEDKAKPAYDSGLPPATIIPPSVRPLLRNFMVGDKGKTVGGWAYNIRAATVNGHLYVEHNDNGLPSQVRRQYEMIHAKDGSAGAAGPDYQLLTPDEFLP